MTAKEIRATSREDQCYWLREIAAQLAELNEKMLVEPIEVTGTVYAKDHPSWE
jgi:hypothetical protein